MPKAMEAKAVAGSDRFTGCLTGPRLIGFGFSIKTHLSFTLSICVRASVACSSYLYLASRDHVHAQPLKVFNLYLVSFVFMHTSTYH